MQKTWDNEIAQAESARTADITAMDIMKTKTMACHAADLPYMNVNEVTPEEEWIQLGLDLERTQ